jgi:hypothetical protein
LPPFLSLSRFATSPELNSFSALIHSFYTSECTPFPAVHLTLDPSNLSIAAYTASPIGLASSSSSSSGAQLAFAPVEVRMLVQEQDRPGLDLLSSNLSSLSALSLASASEQQQPTPVDADVAIPTPLAQLSALLSTVRAMLDQVLAYVSAVAAGEREGDAKVGRALLETVGSVPAAKEKKTGQAGEKEVAAGAEGVDGFEEEFNQHLADVLMVRSFFSLLEIPSKSILSHTYPLSPPYRSPTSRTSSRPNPNSRDGSVYSSRSTPSLLSSSLLRYDPPSFPYVLDRLSSTALEWRRERKDKNATMSLQPPSRFTRRER